MSNKIKSLKRVILSLCIFILTYGGSCYAASHMKITDYHYLTHYNPGETVTFTVIAKNEGSVVINYAYGDIVLTNQATGAETEIGGGATNNITVGTTITSTATWTAQAGTYSVTIQVIESTDGVVETRADRKFGSEPVRVGTTTDSVSAFPRVLDLGTLQYGRYMHPMPLEINWSVFTRSSQLLKDHPWYMRIYTDNHRRYQGIEKAVYAGRIALQEEGSASAMGGPGGLVSADGKYTLPLKVWCLNFGPDVEDGWDTNLLGPPPVKENQYWKGPLLDDGKRDSSRSAWLWIPDYADMTSDVGTWRKLIGRDPFNSQYSSDSNVIGDFTLDSPFQVFLAYETSPTTVVGKYSTDLIIEIYSP